jgi:hypothetical protein
MSSVTEPMTSPDTQDIRPPSADQQEALRRLVEFGASGPAPVSDTLLETIATDIVVAAALTPSAICEELNAVGAKMPEELVRLYSEKAKGPDALPSSHGSSARQRRGGPVRAEVTL